MPTRSSGSRRAVRRTDSRARTARPPCGRGAADPRWPPERRAAAGRAYGPRSCEACCQGREKQRAQGGGTGCCRGQNCRHHPRARTDAVNIAEPRVSRRPICSAKWSRLPGRPGPKAQGGERPGSVEDLADLGPARQAAAALDEGGIDRVVKPGARNGGCARADGVRRAHGSPGDRSERVLCVQQDPAGLRRIRVSSSHRVTAQGPAPRRPARPGHFDDKGHCRRPHRRGLPSGRPGCGAGGMQSAARGGRCGTDCGHQEVLGGGWHRERAESHARLDVRSPWSVPALRFSHVCRS